MKKVYLNTVIALADGLTQSEFTDYLVKRAIEVDGIEYRYELFSEDKQLRQSEFLKFLETGKLKKWEVLLSIPDDLFHSEGLNPKLDDYLKEAELLGAHRIKLNIGQVSGITKTPPQELKRRLEYYHTAINIENDQTQANGTLAIVLKAINLINETGLPIGYTFDAGNFGVMKEDAEDAFNKLSAATSIFHVKNINHLGQATLLNNGIMDWKSYLNLDIPYVLEYPMAMDDLKNELTIFKEALY